ncbi:HDOD domain-containing protein [Aliiglaciecola sp. CAU 1673]|uniref:HDOD domain-containing protein n=1 Tax=Aliiglaciecola sp. CAU 1673 TaxID=3032595 RepID=UPI0023DA9F91|nr:HDOD domain-containing protein [Aliiglaciecola sp. CAU 1673]MDF2179475.1 HDOD domain-containing protein [Aliiglaciecola sp. CAU 1673]
MSTENALFTLLQDKIKHDTLILPSLPAIALRVTKAAEDPEINLAKLSDVISHDAAMTARIVKVANSGYLGRSIKVESLQQAVTRIGLKQIKNISVAIAMEQLFNSKHQLIRTQMQKSWQESCRVMAGAAVLFQEYVHHHRPGRLCLDSLTLASLLSNIGHLPIFMEAERHPNVFAGQSFLEYALMSFSSKVAELVLKAWEFPNDIVEAVTEWRQFKERDAVDYADFMTLSALLQDGIDIAEKPRDWLEYYKERELIEGISWWSDKAVQDRVNSTYKAFAH